MFFFVARQELAELLGFNTFADFNLKIKMAKDTPTVCLPLSSPPLSSSFSPLFTRCFIVRSCRIFEDLVPGQAAAVSLLYRYDTNARFHYFCFR